MKKVFLIIAVLAVALLAGAAETNIFETLTIDQAHELALKNHPQIAAANYRALAAQEAVKESRSAFFPQASIVGSAVGADSRDARIEAGGLNNPSVFNRAAGGLQASQLITDFGRTANLTASSKYQAQAENQNANATRERVLLNVDVNYLGTLEAQAVINVARQTVDTRQKILDQVSLLASNKIKSELDVSFAKVQLEQGQLLLQSAQNGFDASQAALSTALGFREFRPFNLVEAVPPVAGNTNDVSSLVDAALQRRPEILALMNEQNASLRFARAQRDARLPTVAAVGVAGASPVHDERLPDNYAAGGVQLSLPLFAGGMYVARQHEAEFRAHADSELLRSLEDNIIRDVRIAWLNLNNARERYRTTQDLVNEAKLAFELAQARYKVGTSSIVELSQAQLQLTSAQIDETNARYDVLLQEANLNYQIGGLSARYGAANPQPKQSQPQHS